MAQVAARELRLSREDGVFVDDERNLLGVVGRVQRKVEGQVDSHRQGQADPAVVGGDRLAVTNERYVLAPADPGVGLGVDDAGQVGDDLNRAEGVERECQAGGVVERYGGGGGVGMHLVGLREIAVRLDRLRHRVDRDLSEDEPAVDVETLRVKLIADQAREVGADDLVRVAARDIDLLADVGKGDDEGLGCGGERQRQQPGQGEGGTARLYEHYRMPFPYKL